MLLIGVDCAADPRNVGVSFGTLADNAVCVERVFSGRNRDSIIDNIGSAIRANAGPALLCLDAPLGWPHALGNELATHTAGAPLKATADQLFARETDRFVRQVLGKRPLEVGANFIARTARAALGLLESIREVADQPIPLGWEPLRKNDGCAALETYPAAVLACRGLTLPGYKKDRAKREQVLASLSAELHISDDLRAAALSTEHALDAVLCLVAGMDFQHGLTLAPTPELQEAAKKEGWIWVRRKCEY
ncbi:DUF429 domain-containing protein [Oceanidesulfovibrio indonesiensis]|uniref:DUF429 domain-containing protein n=1 Tax=Oceanidesulfovibrio indonesiensis TaxID=54767 RepID=A0A7M3MD14_9BACT|nr:DUF429 domain-containing protein [Oceanidesulfovibrio indonesiensis]TVM15975.1 DUF429 domain-containing protein [Oceanidesulfovibrio indonesiensis]